MERILREQKLALTEALFSRAFDLSSPVIYFPVRHHSPACAWHLQETIRRYRPEAILVEGPADAQHLIPTIVSPLSTPPFCIYYSYDDREGLVDDGCEKYRAYYPFLEYSPERIALWWANELGIDAKFIDLPYAYVLVNRCAPAKVQRSFLQNEEFEVNRYTSSLAKKAGCRSFSEFWEKMFELDAFSRKTEDFVRQVLTLAYYMRESEEKDSPHYRDDLLREQYMRQQIDKAVQKGYARILVVTGAFHIRGLLEPDEVELLSLKPCNEGDVASYLMPYTFPEVDSRSGYGAGIPFPAFYQSVWKKLGGKAENRKNAYTMAVLESIVKTARYARKTQVISLPDEVNAFHMARSLAMLRDKPCPGVFELLDGVRSAFVKGDINSTATFELDFLFRLLSGMGAGSVAAGDCVPPVVLQFRALCAKYRLKTGTVERQEVTLDIVKNPAHYEKSRFLHQLAFLETEYCRLLSGPDYVTGRDRNLVRETWACRYGTKVETRLIDLSVYGATLSQICASLIQKSFRDSMTAQELGKLLLSVQVMGVEDFYTQYADKIEQVIDNDGNFVSLCQLTASLRNLANMQRLLEGTVNPAVPSLMGNAFQAAAGYLFSISQVGEEEEQQVCEQLKALYALSVEQPDWCNPVLLEEQVGIIAEGGFCNSRVFGTCLAIYQKQGHLTMEEFCQRITAYLAGCLTDPEQAASFICGVFLAGRDALFADEMIFSQLDALVAAMDAETFLSILPNLRYAFTSFLPAELSRIGKMAAVYHGAKEDALFTGAEVSQTQLQHGMLLDAAAMQELEKWGLGI